MRPIVIVSTKDTAGMNISKKLYELDPSIPLHHFNGEIVHAEEIDSSKEVKNYNPNLIIFASKHQGKKEAMLSVHAPGNWRKAEYGGKESKVCLTSATALKIFFKTLDKLKSGKWETTLECTHHGPYISKPCLFIEIGSNEEDWSDETAATIVANTIIESLNNLHKLKIKFTPAIGIGGPHYCPNFKRVQLNSNYAISHIIPEYQMPITKEMITEAIKKTKEKPDIAILDWKGLGKSKNRLSILKVLEEARLKILRTSEIIL